MDLECSVSGISHLTSRPQQVRVITERWFGRSGYCISCYSDYLLPTKPNTIAHDFICPQCGHLYELKSSSSQERGRVVDGAYATMISRIREDKAPSLMLLQYQRGHAEAQAPWKILRLVAIHSVFLTEVVVEARKPLSADARRAGWQGCNIRLDRVPEDGRIEVIRNSQPVDRMLVRKKFASAQRLAKLATQHRGWTALVLGILRKLGNTFTLQEVYAERRWVEEAYPNNRNVEAKLRQQLQILRDLGFVEFRGRGSYAVTKG